MNIFILYLFGKNLYGTALIFFIQLTPTFKVFLREYFNKLLILISSDNTWNQNLSFAPMASKSMRRTGIVDNKFVTFAEIIDQLASIVDRELSTIPELSDFHLSVLNDGHLSAVSDNVADQEQFTAPIFNELYIDYDDIEDFLTNFDFKKEVSIVMHLRVHEYDMNTFKLV